MKIIISELEHIQQKCTPCYTASHDNQQIMWCILLTNLRLTSLQAEDALNGLQTLSEFARTNPFEVARQLDPPESAFDLKLPPEQHQHQPQFPSHPTHPSFNLNGLGSFNGSFHGSAGLPMSLPHNLGGLESHDSLFGAVCSHRCYWHCRNRLMSDEFC